MNLAGGLPILGKERHHTRFDLNGVPGFMGLGSASLQEKTELIPATWQRQLPGVQIQTPVSDSPMGPSCNRTTSQWVIKIEILCQPRAVETGNWKTKLSMNAGLVFSIGSRSLLQVQDESWPSGIGYVCRLYRSRI